MRSGGSSTIPVVISVAVAGICVALAVWSYTLVGDETRKLEAVTKKLARVEKEVNSLRATVKGLAVVSAGSDAAATATTVLAKALESSNQRLDKGDRKDNVAAALTHRLKLSAADQRRCDDLKRQRDALRKDLDARIEAAKNSVKKYENDLRAAQERSAANRAKWEKSNREIKKVYDQANRDLNKNVKSLQADVRRLKKKLDKMKDLRLSLERRIAVLVEAGKDRDKESDIAVGAVATDRRIFQPDGKVINTAGASTAIIDIGSDDGVKADMIFRIYYREGNERMLTSMGIVKDVYKSVSSLRLYDQEKTPQGFKESDRPVVRGNYVATPMPLGRNTVFFLNGNFDMTTRYGQTLGIADLKAKILEYGGTIGTEITVETDIVVLGLRYEKKYLKQANRLGKKVISKADILEFLTASDS